MGLSESNWWGSQVFCTADIKAPRWCLLLGTELHQQRNKVLLSYTERNEMRLYKDTHLTHSSLLFSFLLCLSQLHLVSLHKVTTVMKSWRSLIHLLLILSRKVLTVARRSSRSEYNSLCGLWVILGDRTVYYIIMINVLRYSLYWVFVICQYSL